MRHLQLTDELHEQASLYAVGALSETERVDYVRHLETDQCEVCRAAVIELQGAASFLAYSLSPATPSPSVKARLMEQARQSVPAQLPQPALRRWGWFEWVAGAVAVGALAALFLVVQDNRALRRRADELTSRISQLEVQLVQQRGLIATVTAPQNRVLDLAGQGTNVAARARIFWDQPGMKWVFFVRDLPQAPNGSVYQLWFVPKAGMPLSAQVFHTESNGSYQVEISLPGSLSDFKVAAVTIEPEPGQLQPTGPFALLGVGE
jgi:anti-sigma-K factor RskA